VTDESKLRQALLNLIGNAVKFSDKGGVILSAGTRSADGDAVTLWFEVADTGPGLSADEMKKLFQPFVQGSAGVKAGGTGLGLAISRQYARLLGGDVTVESKLGNGAAFTLTVTARIAHELVAASSPVTTPHVLRLEPGQPPVRILIADNVPLNQELLVSTLAPMGFETQVANNGVEAVELFKSWKPHAVLMDMRMPVMDGYEANRLIKATDGGQDTFIIALTSTAFEEEKPAVFASGADVFMRKPFKQDELLAAIGKHLKLRFVYADLPAPVRQADADFTHIPEPIRTDVLQACGEADYDRLVGLCNQLAADGHAAAANALRERVNAFDYESIARVLAEPIAV
jgi:CheY-like chemotaxis protein